MMALLLSILWSVENFAQTTLFNTRYEPTTSLNAVTLNRQSFEGVDGSAPAPNDWDALPDYGRNLPPIWIFNGLTEGMQASDMIASIDEDPLDSENNVLKFTIDEPNTDNGRLQTNVKYEQDYLYGQPKYQNGLKHIRYTTKLYIPDDFEWMLASDIEDEDIYNTTYNFMTLAEFFNSESDTYSVGNSFRISLNLHKQEYEDYFKLTIKGEPYVYDDMEEVWKWGDEDWHVTSTQKIGKVSSGLDFELNQWLNLDVTLVEGDDNNGRFILKINSTTIFDITDNTHHVEDERLDGFHHIMPQKLYTRKTVVDAFTLNSATLHVFWDDFLLQYIPVDGTNCNKIGASIRDAEQNSNGSMDLNDVDLDLDDKHIGLQFDGFVIPNGTTITEAYIRFVAKDTDGGIVATTIKAENSVNPDEFTTSTGDLSGREFIDETYEVSWNIPPWITDETYQTPDISSMIEHLLNEKYFGFEANDILSIVLFPGSNSSERVAYSWDSGSGGNSAKAPYLCISYISQITGEILTHCSDTPIAVPGVTVKITPTGDDPCLLGDYDTTPGSGGNYQQTLCGETAEYEIEPRKTGDNNCGLSAMDAALLRNHLNGNSILTNPMHRIAADINLDGLITQTDRNLLWSRLIGYSTFAKKWIFIANDGTLDDDNPLHPPTFNERIIGDYPSIINADFYIQKMGDLDCDCVPGIPWTIPPVYVGTKLILPESHYNENDIVNLAFEVEDFENITAYQIGLAFDPEKLEYLGASPGTLNHLSVASNFNIEEAENGIVRIIWVYEATDTITTDTTLTDGSNIFNFTFKSLDNIASIENEIWLDDLIIPNVAFESDGTPHAIDLNGVMALAADRSSEEEEFTKEWITNVECYPNPTYDVLNFRIELKEDSKTQILIFDQLGRSIVKEEMNLSEGEQTVKFNNINNWANGLYYYTVKTNDAIFSGTFIKAPDR